MSAIWPAATEAAERVESEMVVGLGTGRAAAMFVRALARRVHDGLAVRGVPTSVGTAELAKELSVPLATLDEVGNAIETLRVSYRSSEQVMQFGSTIMTGGP